MAIQKDTPTSLVKAGGTYVVLPTESAKLIKDPVSFAIWAYLLSKPENWIVRNSEIQDRFGIGRDKTTSAIGHLRDIGLVWDQFSRDESGKVCGRSLVCSSQPNNAIAVLRNSRNTGEPYYGKDGVLVSIDPLEIIDKESNDVPKELLSSTLDGEVKQVIGLLNSLTGARYKASAKANTANISARLKDGHSLDDLLAVVRFKCAEWLHDPKMSQYLRPGTLFQPGKFDGYLTATRAAQSPLAEMSAISRKNAQNLAGEW